MYNQPLHSSLSVAFKVFISQTHSDIIFTLWRRNSLVLRYWLSKTELNVIKEFVGQADHSTATKKGGIGDERDECPTAQTNAPPDVNKIMSDICYKSAWMEISGECH